MRQARSQETLERLLESTESLLAHKGFEGVTVAEIAARAGMSVGAVYSRFRDKDAVLQCLLDGFSAEARSTARATLDPERWEGASVEEIVSELLVFLVEIHRERVGILRELAARAHRVGSPGMLRKEELLRDIGERLSALLLARADEIGHPDPPLAVGLGLRLVLGYLENATLTGDSGAYGLPTSDDRLAAELTRTYLSYLAVKSGPDDRGDPQNGDQVPLR